LKKASSLFRGRRNSRNDQLNQAGGPGPPITTIIVTTATKAFELYEMANVPSSEDIISHCPDDLTLPIPSAYDSDDEEQNENDDAPIMSNVAPRDK